MHFVDLHKMSGTLIICFLEIFFMANCQLSFSTNEIYPNEPFPIVLLYLQSSSFDLLIRIILSTFNKIEIYFKNHIKCLNFNCSIFEPETKISTSIHHSNEKTNNCENIRQFIVIKITPISFSQFFMTLLQKHSQNSSTYKSHSPLSKTLNHSLGHSNRKNIKNHMSPLNF